MSSFRRRQMLAAAVVPGGGGGVPAGYTQVEYLERQSGGCWIDTGFIPVQDDVRAVIEVYCDSGWDNIFFGMKSYNGNDFAFNFYNHSLFYWWWGGKSGSHSGVTGGRNVFEIGPNAICDGNVYASPTTVSKTFVGNTSKITLFGLPNAANPTGVSYQPIGKVYEFSIYYGDALQMRLIPCRDANNVGYMYDTVSGQILGNSGSDSFSIGPDVTT